MKKMVEDNLIIVLACAWLIMSGAARIAKISMILAVGLIMELFNDADEIMQTIWVVTGFIALMVMCWLSVGIIICCLQ